MKKAYPKKNEVIQKNTGEKKGREKKRSRNEPNEVTTTLMIRKRIKAKTKEEKPDIIKDTP